MLKAKIKLANTRIGMDEDPTYLQQKRKNAAGPAFMNFKLKGGCTQWRAEKLFVMDGGHRILHLKVTSVSSSAKY